MNVVPYEKVKDALIDYISFMLNISEYECDSSDIEKTDRKRKALHDNIVKAFGYPTNYCYREKIFTFSVEKITSSYEPIVDDSKNVEWLSKYVYDYISDNLRCLDYYGVKTNRRLRHYGLYNLEKMMKGYNDFIKECESVLKEWDSLRDRYNKSVSTSNEKCETKSFWHEVNGAKFTVKECEKIMREFLSLTVEAYTEPSVKTYWDNPWNLIVESKKKIAYETVNCQIYMKKFKEEHKEILKKC